MTIYAFPTLGRRITQLEWSLVSNTQSFTSPLSGAVQTVEMPGARWKAAFSLSALDSTDSGVFRAWLGRLRGQSGRFYMHNMARSVPIGNYVGSSPTVNGAGQVGTTINTTGWLPSTAGVLRAGDFIGVNGELKMVVTDASSDGAGAAAITFEPPLRSSPANASPIITTKPTAIFKMDDDIARWTTTAPLLDSVSISCTEAW